MYIKKLKSKAISNPDYPVVNTKYGKLRGTWRDDCFVFKGIEYAKSKRFHLPTEPDKWEGIKDAVALVVNQTSKVGETHLLDTLLAAHIQIKKVFAPEHEFRGDADAGETIRNGKDTRTGIPFLFVYALQAGCPTDGFLLLWRFGLQPMPHASL